MQQLKALCQEQNHKQASYASYYSSGKGFDAWTNHSLCKLDQSLQYARWEKGGRKKHTHTQNLHLANPLKSLPCRATCLRKSTSVWRTWTAYLPRILRHFTSGTPACPANLAIFPPWRRFYGWAFSGGEPWGGGVWAGRQKKWKTPCWYYGDSSLCNRWSFTTSHYNQESYSTWLSDDQCGGNFVFMLC